MLRMRIIPALLIRNSGLVKTVRFKNERYVGDPINAIRIFNDKEVDELVVLDISATRRGSIDFSLLSRMNKEAFMPMAYGGGIKSADDVQHILGLGYEKIVLDSAALDDPCLIGRAATLCGSSSVVVCIDIKRDLFGHFFAWDYRDSKRKKPFIEYVMRCESEGAGELILYDVDREGTFSGYDAGLIRTAASSVGIPVVALGGAKGLDDFKLAKDAGAAAAAAGSIFVFKGPHRAVLITYPGQSEIKAALSNGAV